MNQTPGSLQPLNKLMGTIFDPRRIFSETGSQKQPSRQGSEPELGPEPGMDGVPELLKPSIQRYSARWSAAQQRHDSTIRKCKLIDTKLGQLQVSLCQHDESASNMACEINNLASTKRQLAAAKSQADELIPVLKALEQLYAKLSDSSTAWSTDLVQQESEFRQSRHQHYLDLQQTMDEQYAELRRDSVHMRVANAERSFKRDLDSYVQNQSSPRQRSHTNVSRAAAGGAAASVADVVLAPENWAGGSCADQDFFGDSDEAGLKSLGTIKQRPKSGTMPSEFGRFASRQGKSAKKGKGFSAAARANYKDGDEAKILDDDDDDERLGAESHMGFVVLGDEDFSGT